MSTDELVDPSRLAAFLASERPGYTGGFTVERIGEGQSCLTFLIRGNDWTVVLRRPPRGDLPPSAFDVTREYRVMRALHDHKAPVPVPPPILLCEDTSVIGAPFYLMGSVDGVVVRDALPDALSSFEDRERMADQLIDTLVALHGIDHASVGLDGFGKPEGYLERQLRRMSQLWELARFREQPDIEAVGEWLAGNIPEQRETTIVHGDYKLDNVILAPTSPAKIVAVVDWEMSTIGDPLADLGWMVYFWLDPGDGAFRGPGTGGVTHLEGFPHRPELVRRYAERSGRDVGAINWYTAMAGWKIAIIMEGSYRRYLGGITDHPTFGRLDEGVPSLAHRAAQAMRGELVPVI
ncbi:MAG: phosphotransferase family protein [Actinomycetota bacterium]